METGNHLHLSTLVILLATSHVLGQENIPDKSVLYTLNQERFYVAKAPYPQNWISNYNTSAYKITNISTNGQSLFGAAADVHQNRTVFSDKEWRSLILFDHSATFGVHLHLGTSRDVGQVTIDWRAKNVYWTDTGFRWIGMKDLPESSTFNSLDTTFRVVVDKYLERPTGLVVDPSKFFLFWADAGTLPKIERSDLVGKHRKLIAFKGLIHPVTLCVDSTKGRLYWSDAERGTIEYCDYNGDNRGVLKSRPGTGFYGIDRFQNTLFYTTTHGDNGFVSLSENTFGEEPARPFHVQNKRLYHVLVFDNASQPLSASERCDVEHETQKCSQICVHESELHHECYCRDGFERKPTTKGVCEERTSTLERHLLFTKEASICAVEIYMISVAGRPVTLNCSVVPSMSTNITRFALDMANKKVYHSNGQEIFGGTAYTSNFSKLYSIDTETDSIIDMDFDWITMELFWIQADEPNIYMINTTNNATQIETIIDSGSITNLAVDPHNGLIYVMVKDSNDYQLYSWDRQEIQVVSTTSLLGLPTDLEYDRLQERLAWNDGNGYVGILPEHGQPYRIQTQSNGKQRHAVTLYKNFIISSTGEISRVFDVHYEIGSGGSDYHLNITGVPVPVRDMHVFDRTLQPTELEPCEVDNGGCDHVCRSENGTKICNCHLGYTLDPTDKKTCTIASVPTEQCEYFVIMDESHHKFYQVGYQRDIYALEINANNQPVAMAINSAAGTLAWVDKGTGRVKSKQMRGGTEVSHQISVSPTAHIAIDPSTGNIYVTSDKTIKVIGPEDKIKTLLTRASALGTIALLPYKNKWKMAWVENKTVIFSADMDGSNIVPITGTSAGDEIDDIIFDVYDGDSLYWCSNNAILRYKLSQGTTETVYKDDLLQPAAIDVKNNDLFFVPRYERTIYKKSKDIGSGSPQIVYESPLLGSMDNFFVCKESTGNHKGTCSTCNGQCSDICLPIRTGNTCACRDGDDSVAGDPTTCTSAYRSRCLSFSGDGVNELAEACCPNQPNAVCGVTCADGYTRIGEGGVSCSAGKWNVSASDVCEKEESSPSISIAIIAGAAGGGLGLIIIIVVIVIIVRRRTKPKSGGHQRFDSGMNISGGSRSDLIPGGAAERDYAGLGDLSPDPPPREPEEEPEEVYDELKESEMNHEKAFPRVDLPPLGDRNKLDTDPDAPGNRYSQYPPSRASAPYMDFNDGGYMHPVSPGGRTYPQNGPVSEDEDGYLTSNSISAGSLPGKRMEDFASGGSRYAERPRQADPRDDFASDSSYNPRQSRVAVMSNGDMSNGSVYYKARGPAPPAHLGGYNSRHGSGSNARSWDSNPSAGYSTRIDRRY